jgi:hypothetical protein
LLEIVRRLEPVIARRRLAQEREGDDDRTGDRERCADEKRSGHASANAPA